jgi:hypothetical protein
MILCRAGSLLLATLAVAFGLTAVAGPMPVRAAEEPSAIEDLDVTTWDEKRPKAGDRSSEYKTDTTETWIRLTPFLGLQWFSEFDLSGRSNSDNDPAILVGMMLEFDVAETLVVSTDFNISFIEYHEVGAGGVGTSPTVELESTDTEMLGIAAYVSLKNPELNSEEDFFQFLPGLGAGVKYFTAPDDGEVADSGVEFDGDDVFEDVMLIHASIVLRFELNFSKNFKMGIFFREHFVLYASEAVDDEAFDEDGFGFGFIHEPTIYFSICF